MKRINKKHHQPWCKFCPERTVKAEWQSQHTVITKHACAAHKDELMQYESSMQDSGRMTEADYQTWHRM